MSLENEQNLPERGNQPPDGIDVPRPDTERVLQLSRELGGIGLIPDEELFKAGYRRLGEDRAVPIGFNPPPELAEMPISLAEKDAKKPFETFDLTVFGNAEATVIDRRGYAGFLERAQAKAEAAYHWGSAYPALADFAESFHAVARRREENTPWQNRMLGYIDGTIESAFEIYSPEQRAWKAVHAIRGSTAIGDDERISQAEASNIWTELEVIRSQLSDRDQHNHPLDYLKDDIMNYTPDFLEDESGPGPDNHTYQDDQTAVKEMYPTEYDLFIEAVSVFLEIEGMPLTAESLRQTTTEQEGREVMQQAFKRCRDLKDAYAHIKNIKGQLASANDEQRRALNQELKEVEHAIKDKKHLLKGAAEFFDVDRILALHAAKVVKELQDDLMAKPKAGDGDTITLRLDSGINQKLDEDPGRKVGDCTAGNPLPFLHPSVPIYNVKVFETAQDKHLGNIYMLVTQDEHGRSTWHLEAVQLPTLKISWSDFPEQFVAELSKRAKAAGIQQITINCEDQHISNFDYISDTFLGYVKSKEGIVETNIIYPKTGHYQGDGTYMALWRDDAAKTE